MQKLMFTLVAVVLFSQHGNTQPWDKHMEVKKMSISVKTDAFTATTFIEMEFYNPTNTEMEGLYRFTLEPGQAITAFQLDLFGKYRDGSIEEKWKATNAYNTIVGKRVDPALLTMDHYNNYSLRIYPVPAKNSRKITMTIQQLLVLEKDKAVYKLPLNIMDIIEKLNVTIDVKGSSGLPSVIKGLLQDQVFGMKGSSYELIWQARSVKAEKPLSFSIPLSFQQHELCLKNVNEKAFFALRYRPGIRREYRIQPLKLTVFWDVSTSVSKRNVSREISFLKQYVAGNGVKQLTIISFNQQIQDTAVFYTGNNYNSRWVEYLGSLSYEGATQFGLLDFSKTDADAIFLFSDGRNSFGSALPVPGKTHVYCISSTIFPDTEHCRKIIGQTGGQYIDLGTESFEKAIEKTSKAENILLGISAGDTKLDIDQQFSELKGDVLLLTGILPAGHNEIRLSYGNNGKIQEEEKISVTADNICDGSAVDRINMLSVFDAYAKSYYWMDALYFGKKEKVVTPNTAYIVLEKVEDYIKFNITPPKELESQCDMNQFVKADEQIRQQYKKLGEFEILSGVAATYNQRIAALGSGNPGSMIVLTREAEKERLERDKQKMAAGAEGRSAANGVKDLVGEEFYATDKVTMGTEVVVTALGQSRQPKELGYSVTRVWDRELTQAKVVNVQNGLTGKVSGLNVTTTNSGVFGDTRITLRGIRSLTGNNQPMIILDGFPVEPRFLNMINPNDVRDVTILKSASATAIYGPDGANGALVIQTKKGSRGWYSYYWGTYKLKNQDDEDYLATLKETDRGGKLARYEELKKIHGDGAGFYIDVAQHLFESGFRNNALAILFSAAEITGGDKQVLKAMGYTLEAWKEFKEAIRIYQQLLLVDENDLQVYRDLAFAYYQDKNYQQAINTFYEGILKSNTNYEYYTRNIKAMMLQEMNAIISLHGKELDITAINQQLISPLTADLRVVLDCNSRNLYNSVSVVEPDGAICSERSDPVKGGRLTKNSHPYYADIESPQEYQAKEAKTGKYRIKVTYSDYANNAMRIPTMIRITTFKNFGRPDQRIEIENVIMDNQNGNIEIGEINW